MCEALMEIMEPQLQQREKVGFSKGIQGTVDILREFGHNDSEIKSAIIRKCDLSEEEAEKYLQ